MLLKKKKLKPVDCIRGPKRWCHLPESRNYLVTRRALEPRSPDSHWLHRQETCINKYLREASYVLSKAGQQRSPFILWNLASPRILKRGHTFLHSQQIKAKLQTEGRRRRGRQRMKWLDDITGSVEKSLSKLQEKPGVLQSMGSQRVGRLGDNSSNNRLHKQGNE